MEERPEGGLPRGTGERKKGEGSAKRARIRERECDEARWRSPGGRATEFVLTVPREGEGARFKFYCADNTVTVMLVRL